MGCFLRKIDALPEEIRQKTWDAVKTSSSEELAIYFLGNSAQDTEGRDNEGFCLIYGSLSAI